MTRALRLEDGQALIIVALAVVAVLGALALAIDWGYGVTQRRVSQNAADAAAIAAARTLATSTELVNGKVGFRVSAEYVFCVAKQYADANRSTFIPGDATTTLTVQLGWLADPSEPTSTLTWVPVSGTCPTTVAGTDVRADTRFVRVVSSTAYRSLVAAVIGQPRVTAQASARAAIAGGETGSGPVWPMVRHYNVKDFNAAAECAKKKCDPDELKPFTFWSGTGSLDDMVYGSFKGLVDLSRLSTRLTTSPVDQLITAWDQTGSAAATPPTPLKVDRNQGSSCPSTWDTQGDHDPVNHDLTCDIPNWAYYTFGGRLSLDSSWQGTKLPAGQQRPADIGSRSTTVCANPPEGLRTPSCDTHALGDWVETAGGDAGHNIGAQLSQYIALHGVPREYTNDFVPGSSKVKYGNAVVVYVYLWDCAETYGKTWSPVPGVGDCSQIKSSGSAAIDRVHLFTVAPFTFYAGLVDTQEIKGFWGGGFGDPSSCQTDVATCADLNAFINTAFLVPDDN